MPPGGVWQATRALLMDWRERGEQQEDPFDLRVALALAKVNCDKAKGPMRAAAFSDLGLCHFEIGDRASDNRHLKAAETASRAAVTQFSKRKDPQNWARSKINLGCALLSLGERAQDDGLLRDAVTAFDDALTVWTKEAAPKDWAASKGNLGLALRWRGTVTQTTGYFDEAKAAFVRCLEELRQDTAPFLWAMTQWNLGDLALARFAVDPDPSLLDEAERHVMDARAVFAEGSDHQTDRCDALLQRIAAARRSA